jgi:hypothetical protein
MKTGARIQEISAMVVALLLAGVVPMESALADRGYVSPTSSVKSRVEAKPITADSAAQSSRPVIDDSTGAGALAMVGTNPAVGAEPVAPPNATSSATHESGSDDQGLRLSGISVSGFLDVVGGYRNSQQDHTNLSILEAEVDFAAAPSDKIELATSITLQPETGAMELTWATAAFSLMSAEHGVITGATLTTGLFNPAFGVDCRRNNAQCRKLVSAPTVVQLTHQGWADVGVQFDLEGPYANFAAYAVNGFEPSADVMQDVIDLTTGLGDTLDVSPSNALGTRLGLKPISNLELGGSFAVGFNKSDQDEMLMAGADLNFTWSGFDVQSEYIFHSINRSILRQDNQGFYVQPTYTFGRAFATMRYDSFRAEGHDRASRFTIGGGYAVATGVELRLETVFADDTRNNETIMQVFAGF